MPQMVNHSHPEGGGLKGSEVQLASIEVLA